MHKYLPINSAKMHPKTGAKTSVGPTVSIVGARGYTGIELAKILLQHPQVQFTRAFATSQFSLTNDIFDAKVADVVCLPDSELMQNLTDVVFLATPAEVSLKLAPQIIAAGKTAIDLSGAFRLKENDYKTWYNFEQTEKKLLADANYGLVPFAAPSQKKLISNPGCYATAIAMALVPLLKKKLIQSDSIVIDAKSGTTGAGRKAAENLLFSEVSGECLPYRVGRHQHFPEIQESIAAFSGAQINPHLATHLLSVKRGIIVSIYAKTSATSVDQISEAFAESFVDYPFVRFGTQINQLASLNQVVGTPFTHISYELVGDKLYLFSCIDNLLKGAASQAVENLNRFLDLPVNTGLHSGPL